MRITAISIDGFGLFDRFDLAIDDGITLIVGDNETGKSTLLRAIDAILFGFEKKNEMAAYSPQGIGDPRSGSLEIETDGNCYRLSRNFATNHTRLELLGEAGRMVFDGSAKPSGRTEEKEAYDELMLRLLGVNNPDLFRNSVLVEQSGLEPEMESVVRRIASGASSADYVVVLERLKQACDDLTMEAPWRRGTARKNRRIETLQTELQDMRRALAQARQAGAVVEESKSRLESVEKELAEASQSLGDQKSWSKALADLSQTVKEKNRLEQQVNECRDESRDIERLSNELKKCSEEIERDCSEFTTMPEEAEAEIAGLKRIKENEDELEQRLQQTESDIFRLKIAPLPVAAIIAGLVLACGGLFLLSGIGRIIMVLFGVAFIGIGLWRIFAAYSMLQSQESARQGKLDEIREQLASLSNEAADVEQHYPLLERMKPDDVINGLRKAEDLIQEKEKLEEALRQRPTEEDARSKYDSLSNELVVVANRLEELKKGRPSLVDVEARGEIGQATEEAGNEIKRLEKRIAELSLERETLIRDLARAEAGVGVSEERLEEDIAEGETRLDRLKLSRDAYFIAVDTLEQAISEFRSSHLARIEQRTSDYLERITGDECRVRLSGQLGPLGIERTGQFFSVEQLSQGARDQLYFALRFASIEEISGETALPILLDDPFVNFDEDRLKAAFDILEKLSESHQVVLFTHDRRYSDWRRPACILERS